ncbi:PPE family protein, partial [Mycobacterium gordonae]
MNFAVLPPEINSLRLFAGAGPGPLLQAASAWEGLAAELSSAAESFASVTAGLTGQAWQGPAAAAMATAAVPYAGWLSAAASEASGAAASAKSVVSVFESAVAAAVHPLAVSANRSGLVRLVLSNLFGQNAPAIAAVEAVYEEMWAQDVAAMVGYHSGASAAVSALAPFAQPLQGLAGLAAGSAAAAAAPAATARSWQTSLGWANVGADNVGFGNIGAGNLGSGNFG